jgi:ectoine hydroxylase-related dioxygenase (phytanoyl-CoA dioxygenase family)
VEGTDTRVVVGSNQREDKLSFGPGDSQPAEMARGSVLFYSGSVYHGGGANRSDTTRIGLNITYNVAWLRQEENQYLSVPREVAETLPTELLRLMGYDRGAYALGYIDDLRDPIEAVRPGSGSTGFAVGA